MRRGIGLVERRIRRLDRHPAADRHRVARVHREVEQHVLELVGIDPRLPQATSEHGLDRDVLAQCPAQQVGHVRHQPADIDRLRFQRLLPREREQPMGQRRGTLHAGHRRIGQPGERAAVRRQPSLQQFDVAADHRQVVVEVVRDAAGEPADRFHLLRLAQRLLGHFAAANLVPQPRQRIVLPLPLPHCQQAECEQAHRCRNAEDQMRRHVVAPFADHRTPAATGGDVDRIIRQPAIGDHALDAVDRRDAANQAALWPVGDDVGQPPVALAAPRPASARDSRPAACRPRATAARCSRCRRRTARCRIC